MPIYEYKCESCGHVMEVLAKLGDPPPLCESTGSVEKCESPTKRVVSLNTFHLKGSGWYKDGY